MDQSLWRVEYAKETGTWMASAKIHESVAVAVASSITRRPAHPRHNYEADDTGPSGPRVANTASEL